MKNFDNHPLIHYCATTRMSYSYKPVLIMALVQHGGKITLSEAGHYFYKYYSERLERGLPAEKSDSIFSNLDCSFADITLNIRTNPVTALLNSPFFEYESEEELLRIKAYYWDSLTADDKRRIIAACENRLATYYLRLCSSQQSDSI